MGVVLRDIKQKTGPNPGGGVNIWVAAAEDVTNIPAPVVAADGSKSIDADIVVVGNGFKHIEFAPGTCKLSHPTVGEDGSKSFETLIDCVVDGDDGRLDLFNDMINGRYIVIHESASGVKRVCGSMASALLLIQANYDGGADQPERNATTFQFKGREGFMSIRYNGAIPVPAVVV